MALLKMTKDWRTCLDIREAVSTVAVDLSKAFDSLCYGLLLAKRKAWARLHKTSVTTTCTRTCTRNLSQLHEIT